MTTTFIGIAIGLAVLLIWIFFIFKAIEEEEWFSLWSVLAFVSTVAIFSIVMEAQSKEEEKGPCVKYDTQYHYNAAAKMTMPVRVCAQRGEWVNEGIDK